MTGTHWKGLGYDRVGELVAQARRSALGQIELMVRCFVDELQRKDFTAFARGYDGRPSRRWRREHAAHGLEKAARMRELQALLVRAGHAGKVDGDYGAATEDAVKASNGPTNSISTVQPIEVAQNRSRRPPN